MSLFQLQKEYILGRIKGLQLGGLYTLVIDDRTEQLLYQVIGKDQLLRIVTSVEKVDARRRLQLFVEGIYLLELTPYTINCVIADVQSKRYKKGHGLFLPLLPQDTETYELYHLLKFLNNPRVAQYFEDGRSIETLHAVLHPVELRVFLADPNTPNSMAIYYNENCGDLVLPQIRAAAKSLVNLMVITGEIPLIRYYCPQDSFHQALRLPELIADEFQRQIDDYAREHHDFPPPNDNRPRSVLLIVDRTLDLYAPLLHEFSYQAIAMDIVESLEKTGKYKYELEAENGEIQHLEVKVENEDDASWVSLRHLHIIEASELIINKINELIKNNPLMMDRTRATTSSDLMYVVAHLQGFDEERRQVTLHKSLIDKCLEINADRKLAEFAADFEQTCAAGGTSFEGVRHKQLHDDLIVLCARSDLHINDKIRLVLIYALYRGGLFKEDFVKLANFIGVNERQTASLVKRCIFNLRKLGFPVVKEKVTDPKVSKNSFHTINNEGTYNTSRFGPGVKHVLSNAAKYQLDEDWFPYFREKPLENDIPGRQPSEALGSLRNPRIKASWAQPSTRSTGHTKPKQRIFCYVAGGITYSETRSIYELSDALNKEVYIGLESLLRPRDFLIGLQTIDDNKHPEDLDLHLWKQKYHETAAPVHLFDQPKPNGAPQALPPSTPNMNVLNSFNVPSTPSSSSVPLHYQKRNSQVNSPQLATLSKEKKRSKLKSLFK